MAAISDKEALLNLTGTIEVKGQNGLCSKLEISQDQLPNALVQRIETQYPTFRQWSSFVQLEPASNYKIFLRRYMYAWLICVIGAAVFTFSYAAVGMTPGDDGGTRQIDAVLIFAIALWIGSAFGGFIGLCCLSQRFNVLLEIGLEDACDHLNNTKGVAFQCKNRKKEIVNGKGHDQLVEQLYIEVHAIPMSSSGSQMLPETVTISSDDGLSISRTNIPTILSDQMSTIHWNTFCEEIDEALKPAAAMKLLSSWEMIVGVGGLALFILVIALSANVVGIPYWAIVVVVGINFGLEYYLDKQYKEKRNMIVTSLTEVCNRANARYPEVSFKVNDDVKVMKWKHCGSGKNKPHGYIEVTKYTTAATTTTTTSTATTGAKTPVNTTPNTGSDTNTAQPSAPQTYNDDDIEIGLGTKDKKSREERLAELDGMKDQLSEDEYYAKRAEILSDV